MIRKLFRETHQFVSTHRAFHHAGVYALLLTGFQWAISRWPVDMHYICALVDHRSLILADRMAFGLSSWSAIAFAFIGLARPNRIDRAAGLIAIGPAWYHLTWYLSGCPEWPHQAISSAAFDSLVRSPLSLILSITGEHEGASVLLVAIYFTLVWLALRITFALTRSRANVVAAKHLRRWNLQRLAGVDA